MKKYMVIPLVAIVPFIIYQSSISASEEGPQELRKTLLEAVQHRDLEAVQRLLLENSFSAPGNCQGNNHPLIIAARNSQSDMIELLIQARISPTCESSNCIIQNVELNCSRQCHPICWAIAHNKVDMARTMLNANRTMAQIEHAGLQRQGMSPDQIDEEVLDNGWFYLHLRALYAALASAIIHQLQPLSHYVVQEFEQIKSREITPEEGLVRLPMFLPILQIAIKKKYTQSTSLLMDLLRYSIDFRIHNPFPELWYDPSPQELQYSEAHGPQPLLFWATVYNKPHLARLLMKEGATIDTAQLMQYMHPCNQSVIALDLIARGGNYPLISYRNKLWFTRNNHSVFEDLFQHRGRTITQTLEEKNGVPRDITRLICEFAAVPERQMPPIPRYSNPDQDPIQDTYLQRYTQASERISNYLRSFFA